MKCAVLGPAGRTRCPAQAGRPDPPAQDVAVGILRGGGRDSHAVVRLGPADGQGPAETAIELAFDPRNHPACCLARVVADRDAADQLPQHRLVGVLRDGVGEGGDLLRGPRHDRFERPRIHAVKPGRQLRNRAGLSGHLRRDQPRLRGGPGGGRRRGIPSDRDTSVARQYLEVRGRQVEGVHEAPGPNDLRPGRPAALVREGQRVVDPGGQRGRYFIERPDPGFCEGPGPAVRDVGDRRA